jgi:hypothetical protein
VPDCYHIVSSEPEPTGNDISDAVKEVGGPGKLHKLSTNRARDKVHSRIHYETMDLASEHLEQLTAYLERKGHTVHHADVIEDFEELGLTVPGYPPGPGSQTTAA